MNFQTQSFLIAGISRSGVAAAEYLLARGTKVFLYDDAEEGSVLLAARKLQEKGGILIGAEELDEGMKESDILVLSPGIPIDHAIPVAFRKAGKRVVGETELGVLALRCPMIAVTGTNGKTTTTSMIAGILSGSGKNAVACGNIGLPLTACAEDLGEDGIAVAEISSFQLETLFSHRPHIAVVLNVTEDHLNRHYNMENYLFLKRKLLKNLTESEYAVLNFDDERVRSFGEKTKAKVIFFSLKQKVNGAYLKENALYWREEKIISAEELPFTGEHDLSNALASICAAKLMGISGEKIGEALRLFRGVPHRQQKIAEVRGVSFIDDSKATNVDATLKAVSCCKEDTILLLGGKDKGYSFDGLFEELPATRVSHVVVYGENAFRILGSAMRQGYASLSLVRPFERAVRYAASLAKEGDCVLLSPASASFDEFSGYEERGNAFACIVDSLRTEEA